MNKKDVYIGMKATCILREEAYYSGYYGEPKCFFEPGEVGIVKSIRVPCVSTPTGRDKEFVVVDFEKKDIPHSIRNSMLPHGGNCINKYTWRVGLDYNNIRKVK